MKESNRVERFQNIWSDYKSGINSLSATGKDQKCLLKSAQLIVESLNRALDFCKSHGNSVHVKKGPVPNNVVKMCENPNK